MLEFEEDLALSEMSYSVGEDGKVKAERKFVSVTAGVRLASRMAKRADPSLAVDFGTSGWQELRDAIQVRNRITHPKSVRDVEIEDNDLAVCLGGFYWLMEAIPDAMESSLTPLREESDFARSFVDALQAGDPNAWAEYLAVKAKAGEAG